MNKKQVLRKGTGMKKILLLGCTVLLSTPLGARMVTANTIEEFNKYYNSETPMVTMYSAAWCGPCKQMKPHFYAAAEAINDVNFCVIDMDLKCFGGITSNIRSIPTTIFSHKGKSVKTHTSGMTRRELDASIEDLKKTVRLEQAPLVPAQAAPSSTPAKK